MRVKTEKKIMWQYHLYNLQICLFWSILFALIIEIVIILSSYQETGWVPQHVIARDDSNNVLGVIPLYLKRFAYFQTVFLLVSKKEKGCRFPFSFIFFGTTVFCK